MLEMWQDVLPGKGLCRYCGYPPGPVCGSYKCNEMDNREDEMVECEAIKCEKSADYATDYGSFCYDHVPACAWSEKRALR